MSTNPNDPRYGYGIDIALKFDDDGQIDLIVDETGDLATVGGSGDADISIKIQNIFQQMKIRLSTPVGSLFDENGNIVPIGSQLATLIGNKMNDMNALLLKNYTMMALDGLEAIDSILDVRLIVDSIANPTFVKSQIFFTIKEDTEIYYTTIDLINIGE